MPFISHDFPSYTNSNAHPLNQLSQPVQVIYDSCSSPIDHLLRKQTTNGRQYLGGHHLIILSAYLPESAYGANSSSFGPKFTSGN